RLDVGEDRRGSDEHHDFGGRGESKARADHGIAGTNALRHQNKNQRIGSAGAAHHVTRAAEFGGLYFGRPPPRPRAELGKSGHAGNRFVDRAPEAAPLRGDVDEWDRHGIETGALVHRRVPDRSYRRSKYFSRSAVGARTGDGSHWESRGARDSGWRSRDL